MYRKSKKNKILVEIIKKYDIIVLSKKLFFN